MSTPRSRAIVSAGVFAFDSALAALLALYIAFSAGLTNPWWAGLTVLITSQPMAAASGAVAARAQYRIAGTMTGMAAALFILPAFANTPEVLILVVATWLGVFLYLSLLDRSPRSYAFMLAGYSVALVGLPAITDPSGMFDSALARCEEISIGAVCAALVHGLVLPRSIRATLLGKVETSMADARTWIANALSVEGTAAAERVARRRIAADLTELEALATFSRHEAGGHSDAPRTVRALAQRLTALLPLLSGVEDRLQALAKDAVIGEELTSHLAQVRRWITEGSTTRIDLLVASGRRIASETHDLQPWHSMLVISLVQRLEELVRAWDDSLQLAQWLRQPEQAADDHVRSLLAQAEDRKLHVDHGLAAYSGLAAAVAVILAAGIAFLAGWPQGVAAAGIAATGSSVFAFLDDPRPMQRYLLLANFSAAPVAALYGFAILPAVDGYVGLALVLFPLFFITAYFMATPRWLPALSFALVSQTLIAVQVTQAADFTTFTNTVLASLMGATVASATTGLIRVIAVETSTGRLLRAGWRDLATLADDRLAAPTADWTSRMLDRVGMLLPRMARVAGVPHLRDADALGDLRLGVNVAELREVARASESPVSSAIASVLHQVGQLFAARAQGHTAAADATLLRSIDGTVDRLFQLDGTEARTRGLVAATGLRRGLFPDAPPYQPGEASS